LAAEFQLQNFISYFQQLSVRFQVFIQPDTIPFGDKRQAGDIHIIL
jgi:hypothetical protein